MTAPRSAWHGWRQILLLATAGVACGGALGIYWHPEHAIPAPSDTPAAESKETCQILPLPPLSFNGTAACSPGTSPQVAEAASEDEPAEQPQDKGRIDEAALAQHWEAARRALQERDPPRATASLQSLLAEYPGYAPALRALALLEAAQDDSGDDAQWHRQADSGHGETPESSASGWLARSTPEATERIALLASLHPESPTLHFAQGVAFARQNRWAEAASAFQRHLNGSASSPDAWYNLAIAHERLGELPAAAQAYRQALRQASEQPHRFPCPQAERRLELIARGARP